MSNTLQIRTSPYTMTSFNRKWAISFNGINVVNDNLNNKTFLDNLNYLFTEPAQFFISLKAYPFDITEYYNNSLTLQKVKMGKAQMKVGDQDVSAPALYGYPQYKYLGKFKIQRKFNNYLDFSPYTKIEMYLPFAGIITLDTNVVTDKEIRILLAIDFDTGKANYYLVRHEDNQGEYDGDIIQTVECQMGIDIPLGSYNANEQMKNVLMTGISFIGGAVTTMATGNPMPLVSSSINAVSGTFKALQERVTKGGVSSGSNNLMTPYHPYLIITRPTYGSNGPDDYVTYKGRPLFKNCRLGDLKGFTVCNDFHLENFGSATESEISSIDALLKEGIII